MVFASRAAPTEGTHVLASTWNNKVTHCSSALVWAKSNVGLTTAGLPSVGLDLRFRVDQYDQYFAILVCISDNTDASAQSMTVNSV